MPPDTEETLGKCRTRSRWTFSANSECGVCRKPVAVLVLDQTPSPKIRTEAPMPAHTCLFQPPRRSETGKEKTRREGKKGLRGHAAICAIPGDSSKGPESSNKTGREGTARITHASTRGTDVRKLSLKWNRSSRSRSPREEEILRDQRSKAGSEPARRK